MTKIDKIIGLAEKHFVRIGPNNQLEKEKYLGAGKRKWISF